MPKQHSEDVAFVLQLSSAQVFLHKRMQNPLLVKEFSEGEFLCIIRSKTLDGAIELSVDHVEEIRNDCTDIRLVF